MKTLTCSLAEFSSEDHVHEAPQKVRDRGERERSCSGGEGGRGRGREREVGDRATARQASRGGGRV